MNLNDDSQKITALMSSRFDLFYLKTDATSTIIINLSIIIHLSVLSFLIMFSDSGVNYSIAPVVNML